MARNRAHYLGGKAGEWGGPAKTHQPHAAAWRSASIACDCGVHAAYINTPCRGYWSAPIASNLESNRGSMAMND